MIRRDFVKMLSIATAGAALIRFSRPVPVYGVTVLAKTTLKPQRLWLSGSVRSGCAHMPGIDVLPQ